MTKKPDKPLESLGLKNLSDTEFEYMEFLWKHPKGVSSDRFYEHFSQKRGTIGTILFRIANKGYVEKEQLGRHHIYIAKVSRNEYKNALKKQNIKQRFGDETLDDIVAAFCGRQQLTEAQAKKLQDLIEELQDDDEF